MLIERVAIEEGQYTGGVQNTAGISVNLGQTGDKIAFRFPVDGPATSATLRLHLPQASLSSIRAAIRCNADGATLADAPIDDRLLTEAATPWAADDLGSGPATSPDFAAALNEAVAWPAFDGTVCVVLTATEGVDFRASSSEKGAGWQPVLALETADEPGPGPDTEPPPPLTRQISVIVRDIPPGGSHEVRHVRPGEIVLGPAGIDWSQTPYTAYVLVNDVQPAD